MERKEKEGIDWCYTLTLFRFNLTKDTIGEFNVERKKKKKERPEDLKRERTSLFIK